MKNYSLERREAYEKPYLSIDLADLDLLEATRDFLACLECVHRVNISDGKRKHLTVYVQKFYNIAECERLIKNALDSFDDTISSKPIKEHRVESAQKIGSPIKEAELAKTDVHEDKNAPAPMTRTNQLDKLPSDGRPIVFISYAWDDEKHKDWVRKLSDDLRATYGVYTLLDQYNRGGANLVNFMQRGIHVSKRVLIIGSPLYTKKIEDGLASGAVYEDNIINAEIYNGYGKDKFIPVLRIGHFNSSFGPIIGTNVGYDMTRDEKYDEVLEALAADLWDEPEIVAPEPASKPVFKKKNTVVSTSLQPVKPRKDLTQYVKDSFDPYKGEKWLKRLLESFSFNLMDGYFERMPERFNMHLLTSFDMWTAGINQTTFNIKDATLLKLTMSFYNQWKKITETGEMHYAPSNNGSDYYFIGYKLDVFDTPEKEEAFWKINEAMTVLHLAYKTWADYIKSSYPNIDLDETSVAFERSL